MLNQTPQQQMSTMEKLSRLVILIAIFAIALLSAVFILHYNNAKEDLAVSKAKELQYNNNIKLLNQALIENNESKDSIINLNKKLAEDNNKLQIKLNRTENNLLLIKGKYKELTADSSLSILMKKYEMDSINNAKY
jgi:hypothetical protein